MTMRKAGKDSDRIPDTLREAEYILIHRSCIPAKQLAPEMRQGYSTLANKVNLDDPGGGLKVHEVLEATRLTDNDVVIRYIERALHRFGGRLTRADVPLPSIRSSENVMKQLAQVSKEFADLARESSRAMKDGRVTERDADRIAEEAWDLIECCAVIVHEFKATRGRR